MKSTFTFLAVLLLLSFTNLCGSDISTQPAHVIVSPWKQHIPPTKRQVLPGIECTAKGRLWALCGRDAEMQNVRFGVWAIVTNDPDATEPTWSASRRFDDGKTWPHKRLVTPGGQERIVNGIDRRQFPLRNTRAEHNGYLAAIPSRDGRVQLISSKNHYVCNLAWLKALPERP